MRAKVLLCFYNSYKLQGWRKPLIHLMNFSKHTHVHIELEFNNYRLVFLTVDGGSPRIIRLGLNKKFLGVDPYHVTSVGEVDLNENICDYTTNYPVTKHWDLIKYQLKSYFVNVDNPPPTCATFVSDFLRLHGIMIPRFFSPKQLYNFLLDKPTRNNSYDDNNVWW